MADSGFDSRGRDRFQDRLAVFFVVGLDLGVVVKHFAAESKLCGVSGDHSNISAGKADFIDSRLISVQNRDFKAPNDSLGDLGLALRDRHFHLRFAFQL